jgi:hypothetical protein
MGSACRRRGGGGRLIALARTRQVAKRRGDSSESGWKERRIAEPERAEDSSSSSDWSMLPELTSRVQPSQTVSSWRDLERSGARTSHACGSHPYSRVGATS